MLKDLCFEIIEKCPNRCKFCSSRSSIEATKMITIEWFKKTIDHFMQQGGIEEISLSGGEPFLHPDLLEMVTYCKEKGIRTVIFTSGIKYSSPMTQEEIEWINTQKRQKMQEVEENEPWNDRLKRNIQSYYDRFLKGTDFTSITKCEAEQLKELGVDKIVFDWQAAEEETYNQLMGSRHFYTTVVNSMICTQAVGLNTEVHFIPLRQNYKQFADILECLEIAKIKNISILNFVPQGRGLLNKNEMMLSKDEMQEFSQILAQVKKSFSGKIRIGIPLLGDIQHLCTAGTEKLDIKFDGTVLPCPAFKEISIDTMERYGIRLYNIYRDLESIVVSGGKRRNALCKQVYQFDHSIQTSQEEK